MKRKNVLYREVADKMKEAILNGTYPVGSLLPTETELEEMFQVSKITIRNAIELLANDEYVEKRSGRGTTVLSNRPYNKLSKATTFSQLLNQSGQKLTKENLSFEEVTLEPEHPAYEAFGAKACLLRRMYSLDHQPYIYYEYYLPSALSDMTVKDFNERSLYRILDEKQIMIDTFQDSFHPIFLTFEQQKLLITPEKTALKRIRRSKNETGIVEYTEGIYNTALYPYTIEFEA